MSTSSTHATTEPGHPKLDPQTRRTDRRIFWIAVALALVPFVVSAIATLAGPARVPISDHALTQMRVDDVGRHPVLLGLYSRDGWSHPGPMIFYLLAPTYRLLGSSAAALLVGALLINAATMVAMAGVARRVAGLPGALLALVATSVLVRALGADYLRSPWVPYVTVLPFGLLCLLAWAMADDEAWALPAGFGVATYLVQTHVGYAALTAPMLLVAAGWLTFHRRRKLRTLARPAALTVGLLAVLWSPTVWDQLFGTHNLGLTLDWFRAAQEGTHTLADGAQIVLAQFAIVPDWVTGHFRTSLFNGETTLRATTRVPVLLLAVLGAILLAWRHRDRVSLRLLAVLTLGVGTGVVSVARTIGVLYEYRLQWTWVLGSLMAFAIALTVWRATLTTRPELGRVIALGLVVGLGGLAVVNSAAATNTTRTVDWSNPRFATVAEQIGDILDRDGGQVVIEDGEGFNSWPQQGLLLALEREGFAARVPREISRTYGEHRIASPDPVQARVRVLSGTEIAEYHSSADWEILAFSGDDTIAGTQREIRRYMNRNQRLITQYLDQEISESAYSRARLRLESAKPDSVLVLRATGEAATGTSDAQISTGKVATITIPVRSSTEPIVSSAARLRTRSNLELIPAKNNTDANSTVAST